MPRPGLSGQPETFGIFRHFCRSWLQPGVALFLAESERIIQMDYLVLLAGSEPGVWEFLRS